ncbi:MAG: GIY-YIG nuclease family protein [Patescibacteria group bacterium]
MNEQFYLYILECADGSYYVGSTNNVDERLKRHNAGEAAEWTKNRCPVRVVYQEEYESLLKVRRREQQIKGWTRLKKENLISGIWKKL